MTKHSVRIKSYEECHREFKFFSPETNRVCSQLYEAFKNIFELVYNSRRIGQNRKHVFKPSMKRFNRYLYLNCFSTRSSKIGTISVQKFLTVIP